MSESSGNSVAAITPIHSDTKISPASLRNLHTIPWPATWILLLSISAILSCILTITLHTPRGFFVPVLATALCILAALFDAWTTRIPNSLTYPAILAGLALNLAATALTRINTPHAETVLRWLAAPGLSQSLLGFGVCALLGILGLLARVGGGDIKLLAALGALLGLADVGYALMVALAVALVYALLNLALFGRLNTVARLLAIRALELVYLRRLDLPSPDDADNPAPPRHDAIPMAIPLALGLILAQILNIKSRLGAG